MKIEVLYSMFGCIAVVQSGKQIFRDDFNTLDKNQWVPDVRLANGPTDQFQIFSPDVQNCYTKGGLLYLRPTLTSDKFSEAFLYNGKLDVKGGSLYKILDIGLEKWGICHPEFKNACYKDARLEGIMPPLMSCHLRSKVTFKYGKLEIIAQMPRGDWLWPGLWLMPKYHRYGFWPRSGEIDIAETSGNVNFGRFGVQRATASLIFGHEMYEKKHLLGQKWLHGATYADAMHNYTMDWTPNHINLYVDGELINGVPTPSDGMHAHYKLAGNNIWGNSHNAPFDQEFYIILSVATGGDMFSDTALNVPHPKPWSRSDNVTVAMDKFWKHKEDWYPTWHGEKAAMKVDSVTIWSYQ